MMNKPEFPKPRIIREGFLPEPMTDFQPKPQTPEQVDEGLRAAFRQAKKDGVMDATPYLKQMTFNSDIEKTEAEIKVLQAKLELLKEIEAYKSQPRMNFELGGKFEIVSYNGKNYIRNEFNDGSHNWHKRKHTVDGVLMVYITDGETRRLLEGLWFNEVKKGKYDEPYCPDEPEYYDEVEWDEKDNPKTLLQIIREWCDDDNDPTCEELLNRISGWLPKPQSAAGSQNVYVECTVEGFNDCLEKIKRKLR